MKALNKIGMPPRLQKWTFIGGILLLALLLFHPLLIPNCCLFSTDDNIGAMTSIKEAFPSQFWGQWGDQALYGTAAIRGQISWTTIMLGILPNLFVFNWIHAIDLVLASIFLFFFLRTDKLSMPAIALGILTAFWLGSNLTLTYAGHVAKFGILMLAPAFLVCIKKVRYNADDWFWCVIAGGLMGLMFIEQQDVALFFSMFLGLYALFQLVRAYFPQLIIGQGISDAEQGNRKPCFRILRVVLLLLTIPIVALLISSTPLVSMSSMLKSVSQGSDHDDKQAKWEFATQWSWPPEESIDFVAPGYMGWRSGEPDGPYWGRMGRSAGWEKTGQGFMNFKLENMYLGIIPILLAVFAILAGVIGCGSNGVSECRSKVVQGENDSETRSYADTPIRSYSTASTRAEIFFWFFVALITLLLSFGKHFPLYELFYQLPVVSSIRNPNKFLQIFQIAVGILAAYGAHLIFYWRVATNKGGDR